MNAGDWSCYESYPVTALKEPGQLEEEEHHHLSKDHVNLD